MSKSPPPARRTIHAQTHDSAMPMPASPAPRVPFAAVTWPAGAEPPIPAPKAFMTGEEFSTWCAGMGIDLSPVTLACWRSRGTGGPPFHRVGRGIRYPAGPSWAWLLAYLGKAIVNTSGAEAA